MQQQQKRVVTFTPEQHNLWKRVAKEIENRPGAFNMAFWLGLDSDKYGEMFGLEQMDQSCGTTACVAGWTALLSGYAFDRSGSTVHNNQRSAPVSEVAAELLGLEKDVANSLFYFRDEDTAKAVIDYVVQHGSLPVKFRNDWLGYGINFSEIPGVKEARCQH